ncbi:MAG TPA: hypothetical protein VHC69_36100 [Polyangiaceae bacterium]|nr:hypothetical protein [Polyangiaceae bacterium]
MSLLPSRSSEIPSSNGSAVSRWGAPAPLLLRAVAASVWLSLVMRLVALALPGSRSGIGPWIRRADGVSSMFTQLSTLLGSSLLVLLVVGTLSERGFGYIYRLVVVPTSAAVLVLVMLASTQGLEPEATLTLGLSCLALSTAGATVAMNVPQSRAQGLVVSLATLGAAIRLAVRVLTMGSGHHEAAWVTRVSWLAFGASAFDALSIALAAARLRAEHKGRAAVALVGVFVASLWVAWSAMRGAYDEATTWQIVCSRAVSELSQSPVAFGTVASRYALETIAVLFGFVVVFWPGPISAGMMSAALALLSRPGVDVPAAALVLATSALIAPLSRAPVDDPAPAAPPRPGRAEQTPAGADP